MPYGFFSYSRIMMEFMKNRQLILYTALLTALVVTLLYDPVSLAIYKIAEPSFGYPIRNPSGRLPIRNDIFGNGFFGSKRSGGRTHTGVDIEADVGTPVYASKSGVAFRVNAPAGYGKYILIYHPDGTQSMYCHLSDWVTKTGTKVRKGDIIGFVGKTGNASSKEMKPHLHFEIRSNGDPVEPTSEMR